MKVSPCDGGCWFCYTDDGEMYFTIEWDAFFHMDCLMKNVGLFHYNDEHIGYDPEAMIIAREFDIVSKEEYNQIIKGTLPQTSKWYIK